MTDLCTRHSTMCMFSKSRNLIHHTSCCWDRILNFCLLLYKEVEQDTNKDSVEQYRLDSPLINISAYSIYNIYIVFSPNIATKPIYNNTSMRVYYVPKNSTLIIENRMA